MKSSILITILHEEEWRISTECQAHTMFVNGKAVFGMPTSDGGILPDGTVNAVLKHLHQAPQAHSQSTIFANRESVPVVFEKSATVLWARIELPGFLFLTHGHNIDCITERLRSILGDMAIGGQSAETLNFRPVYDTSALWEFIRGFKPARIAEQAGIDAQLLNQIMAGAVHPCPEQTKRLETSLRHLGKQLTQIALR